MPDAAVPTLAFPHDGLRFAAICSRPADAAFAVEARPVRDAAPRVYFFATAEDACGFADAISGWPGHRPLVGRILRGRIAEGSRCWIGEGPTALAVEEIAPEDGRPW